MFIKTEIDKFQNTHTSTPVIVRYNDKTSI